MRNRKFHSEHQAGGSTFVIWEYFRPTGDAYESFYRLQVDEFMTSFEFPSLEEALKVIGTFRVDSTPLSPRK